MLAMASLVAIIAAATSIAGGSDRGPGNGRVVAAAGNARAPEFVLASLQRAGPRLSLEQFSGRPLVINFFASWCVPCRREMPVLQSVAQRFDDSVAFLGVDHEDSRTQALELVARTGVTYPTAYDPKGRLAREYDARGLPSTVFVSADGRIVATRLGELRRAELEEALVRLFRVLPDGRA